MSLAYQPPATGNVAGTVPLTEYQRVCQERDQLRRERDRERAERLQTQEKLSVVTLRLQNPRLTWKERAAPLSVALALEAQRPKEDPNRDFRADLGKLAEAAGLVHPTPERDKEARAKAWTSGVSWPVR